MYRLTNKEDREANRRAWVAANVDAAKQMVVQFAEQKKCTTFRYRFWEELCMEQRGSFWREPEKRLQRLNAVALHAASVMAGTNQLDVVTKRLCDVHLVSGMTYQSWISLPPLMMTTGVMCNLLRALESATERHGSNEKRLCKLRMSLPGRCVWGRVTLVLVCAD